MELIAEDRSTSGVLQISSTSPKIVRPPMRAVICGKAPLQSLFASNTTGSSGVIATSKPRKGSSSRGCAAAAATSRVFSQYRSTTPKNPTTGNRMRVVLSHQITITLTPFITDSEGATSDIHGGDQIALPPEEAIGQRALANQLLCSNEHFRAVL